jgi:predicted nucleotidyltransferase
MADSAASVLFGKTRQAVLALLFTHPEREFYLREIARITSISAGALQHELGSLLRADLILRAKSGNRINYRANSNHPIYTELRAIVEKTSGAPELLRQALAPVADDIAVAFIYGSTAKGKNRTNSDVDLLVVGGVDMAELVERLGPVEQRIQREISRRLFSPKEFAARLKARDRFLTSIVRGPKLMVLGELHEPR